MIDEEKNVVTEQPKDTDTASDYIEVINKMKKETVSRSEYDKLRAENKELLNSLVNGQTAEVMQEPVHPDIAQLRENLFHKEGITNLEYWQNALALREELIRKGERDPFLPYGEKISPTYEDTQAAERVADVVQQCIDYADGDSAIFTNELQRRTNDVRYR